ncbi:MAG: adenosylmethionine decarboxylase [Bernardetiaceae bacterium]
MKTLGRHILLELYDCPPDRLDAVNVVEEVLVGAAHAIGARIVSVNFHHFSPIGVSGVVVIEESHLAIHTWPEYGYAAVDVFTCGEEIDPWGAYHFLKQNFACGHSSAMELRRGQASLLSPTGYQVAARAAVSESRQVWFTQRELDTAFSLRQHSRVLFRERSVWQEVLVFESTAYGKILALDGRLALAEGDEYAYHEMLVHPALSRCRSLRRVLLLGGGDGGCVREVLRYPSVEEVWVVEQDRLVTAAVQAHFQGLAAALSDERVRLHFAEAMAFLDRGNLPDFDAVLVDAQLDVADLLPLLPTGAVWAFSGGAAHEKAGLLEVGLALGAHGTDGRGYAPYLAYVPTYQSGMWGFWLVSQDPEPLYPLPEGLRYLTPDLHRAAFVLPAFVEKLLVQKLGYLPKIV